MVSGMLTAIRDFVRDSFGGKCRGLARRFHVGELEVLVEHWPARGAGRGRARHPPPELRVTLERALEAIHRADRRPRAVRRRRLDLRRRAAGVAGLPRVALSRKRPPVSYRALVGSAPVWSLALLAVLGRRCAALDQRRFDRYLASLDAQPGVVVVNAGRQGGRFVVSGCAIRWRPIRRRLWPPSGLASDRVEGRWELYQALDPGWPLRRAVAVLQPPPA